MGPGLCVSGVLCVRGLCAADFRGPVCEQDLYGRVWLAVYERVFYSRVWGLRLTETCAAGFGGVSGAGGAQQGWTFRDRAPPLGAVFGAVVHAEIWEELRAAKGLGLQVLGW